jgi:hypothetical protein
LLSYFSLFEWFDCDFAIVLLIAIISSFISFFYFLVIFFIKRIFYLFFNLAFNFKRKLILENIFIYLFLLFRIKIKVCFINKNCYLKEAKQHIYINKLTGFLFLCYYIFKWRKWQQDLVTSMNSKKNLASNERHLQFIWKFADF